MEALAAVGLAANILQFVDYVCQVMEIRKQIRRNNGVLDWQQDIERSAVLLKNQAHRIQLRKVDEGLLGKPAQALNSLAEESISICTELITTIEKFKLDQRTDPELIPIEKKRSKHQDEANMEEEIILLQSRLTALDREIQKGEEGWKLKLKKREREGTRLELKNLEDTKRRLRDKLDDNFKREQDQAAKENQDRIGRAVLRRKINSFCNAIKFEWNTRRVDELTKRLERIRASLASEVLFSLQGSVDGVAELVRHCDEVVLDLATTQRQHHVEMQDTIATTAEAHTSRLHIIDSAAEKRHNELIDAVKSFVNIVNTSTVLFPALPRIITDADPSLKHAAALSGYDAIENAVLAALYFRKMDSREVQIPEAYKNTCAWVFNNPAKGNSGSSWDSFRTWLEKGQGCYWIEGKAGCGKSTLMKFLHADDRTHSALKQWSDSSELIVAPYFFWLAGTPLQKNQEGLLRALLHSILDQRRDLISRVFPRLYNSMITKLFANNSSPSIFFSCDSPGCTNTFDQPQGLEKHQRERHSNEAHHSQHSSDLCGALTVEELKNAFSILVKQNLKGSKIFLLIDGLDEYAGNQADIANLFKEISNNSTAIKAVISSRPEPVFSDAFRKCPSLRVDKLTAHDIRHYVRSELFACDKFHSQTYTNSELATKLIDGIASKASGVFLWVFIVIRLLLERLTDGAYVEDLEAIIDEYPDELKELYEHMFDRMKPIYKSESLRLFRAIEISRNIEHIIPSALRLSFLDNHPHQSIQHPLKVLSAEELNERLLTFEARLKSRCCGLFEIQYFDTLKPGAPSIHDGRVVFLHRTVSDFLSEPNFRGMMETQSHCSGFEIYQRLLGSTLYSFKCWYFFHLKAPHEWRKFTREIAAFLAHCQQCEPEIKARQIEYIEELDRALSYFWKLRSHETRSPTSGLALGNYNYGWAESVLTILGLKHSDPPEDFPLLVLAARFGACRYVYEKCLPSAVATHEEQQARVPLLMHLCCWTMNHKPLRWAYIDMIRNLLESGLKINANPETITTPCSWGLTPWQQLLFLPSRQASVAITSPDDEGRNTRPMEANTTEILCGWSWLVELFLRFGATLDVAFKPFKESTQASTARGVIMKVLAAMTTEEGLSFEDVVIMDESKSRIERLLAERPVSPDTTHRHPGTVLPGEPLKDMAMASTNGTSASRHGISSRPAESKKPQNRLDAMHFDPSVRSAHDRTSVIKEPCQRCKTINVLAEMEFKPGDIFEAIEKAGVGHDISALATWILNKHTSDDAADPSRKPTTRPTTTSPAHDPALPKEPRASSGITMGQQTGRSPTQDSLLRQWSVVPARQKSKPLTPTVVGAELVPKAHRARPHRPRSSKTAPKTDYPQESGKLQPLHVGAVEIQGGALTWIFEPDTQVGEGGQTLTEEQSRKLKDFVTSMGW